jgi:beta-N-acetylglucosaminidase/mRNA-degrading endonuclease HigB of HigAB toxin-antitoxin module
MKNVQNSNININKEWRVKFNMPLKSDTVNNKNIIVTDENGEEIPVTVSLDYSSNTIVISPVVSGYDPDKKYDLTIDTNVQSSSGKNLVEPLTMPFSTTNQYLDGTNYQDLPKITSLNFQYTPLLSNEKQGFILNTNKTDNVEYRIFVHSYKDDKEVYTELTNGYTSANNGEITASKTLDANGNGEKYKVIVYVKRENTIGAHKDANTDYDNYYVDYFRCVDSSSVNTSKDSTTKYNITLNDMISNEKAKSPIFVENNDFTNSASTNQIKYYVNPNNFIDDYGKYQFLKLSYTDGITADDINNILKGKGILEGEGQVFLDAAKANNINAAYLVSHALLETGNGASVLANGGLKDSTGNYIYGKPVYNFFGIHAYDSNPNGEGTKAAYNNGWFTPEEAIMGGAQWISTDYINNPNGKQDTLYKMRWNPDSPGQHQYATDVAWSYKQIPNIIQGFKDVLGQMKNAVLTFDIPQFK